MSMSMTMMVPVRPMPALQRQGPNVIEDILLYHILYYTDHTEPNVIHYYIYHIQNTQNHMLWTAVAQEI